MSQQIKVLIVDDSAFMRKVLSEILAKDPGIRVVGTARDGRDALAKVDNLKPDVVTLDVEMPKLDGIGTLRELMRTHPLPVVMLSSVTQKGSKETLEALSLGAVDFVSKPSGSISLDIDTVEEEILRKVKAAADARVFASSRHGLAWPGVLRQTQRSAQVASKSQHQGSLSKTNSQRHLSGTAPITGRVEMPGIDAKALVVIGSSTGGPKALESVVSAIPADLPAAVLIVQHMPPGFTRSLAERLDNMSGITVREAADGDYLGHGLALVAPGGYHLVLDVSRRVHLTQEPPVNYVRPSVDVTMKSVVDIFRHRLVGVILTGMGRDGAEGMALIKQSGGMTIAQDQETSTIYSMPRVVAEKGNADYVLPVDRIGDAVGKLVQRISH